MVNRWIGCLVVALCAASCADPVRDGTCSIHGTLGGREFGVQSCAATFNDTGGWSLDLADFVNACHYESDRTWRAGSQSLSFEVVYATPPLAPGTYPIAAGGLYAEYLSRAPHVCSADLVHPNASDAIDGSLTITSVTSDRVTGTFELTLESATPPFTNDHITGSFDAPICPWVGVHVINACAED